MNIFENDNDYTMTISHRSGEFTTKLLLYMLKEDGNHHKCISNIGHNYFAQINLDEDLTVKHLHDVIADMVSPLKASSFKGIPLKELAKRLGASEDIIRPQWEYHQTIGHTFVLVDEARKILPDTKKLASEKMETIYILCKD